MKALAITNSGCEDIACKEIKEKLGQEGKAKDSAVIFTVKNIDELKKFCYTSQSASKVLLLLSDFSFKKEDDIIKNVKDINFSKNVKGKIAVRCIRIGKHDFGAQDIESSVGEFVIDKCGCEVDLENPDVIVLVYIKDNDCYVGLDIAGFDLSKRQYKIFTQPFSLKGNIAYSLMRLSGFKKGETIVDTFCGSGTICIEAALYDSGFSVNFFNKDKFLFEVDDKFDVKADTKSKIIGFESQLKMIKASKNNAKIAGIEKLIQFSKLDIEWLDTKLDEKSVDRIVTVPPQHSKKVSIAKIEKIYREFFYQAEFVLKDKGTITLLVRDPEVLLKIAEEKRFKLKDKKELSQGQEKFNVLIFEKLLN